MSFPLTSSLFSENPSLYTHLTSWLNPSRDLKPVFAMRELALAKNKSASDSLFFVALFAFRNFLSPRTLHWKESSGTFFWPLHTRSHQRIYRTFDHDWSNLARSINNHIHHLSSIFVDISRWRTTEYYFLDNYKIFILIFWILLRFECEMSLSHQHPFFELLDSQDFFNCVYKYTRYEKTDNSLG